MEISSVLRLFVCGLGFIFRVAKHFSDIHCLKSLYCSLVRSVLEYAAIVWAPFSTQFFAVCATEFALRRSFASHSYSDRCQLIHLNLLFTRRDVCKLLFVSDLILSRINCSYLLENLNFDVHIRTLCSHLFLRLSTNRTKYGYHEPVISMCRLFNQYCNDFDFHLSRPVLKHQFVQMLGVYR